MRSMVLIAMMTAAAAGLGPAVANAEDIALSLLHPKGRVDVPVSAIRRVEAQATFAFRNTESGDSRISTSSRRSVFRRRRAGAHLPADATNRRSADGNHDRLRDDFKTDRARTPLHSPLLLDFGGRPRRCKRTGTADS